MNESKQEPVNETDVDDGFLFCSKCNESKIIFRIGVAVETVGIKNSDYNGKVGWVLGCPKDGSGNVVVVLSHNGERCTFKPEFLKICSYISGSCEVEKEYDLVEMGSETHGPIQTKSALGVLEHLVCESIKHSAEGNIDFELLRRVLSVVPWVKDKAVHTALVAAGWNPTRKRFPIRNRHIRQTCLIVMIEVLNQRKSHIDALEYVVNESTKGKLYPGQIDLNFLEGVLRIVPWVNDGDVCTALNLAGYDFTTKRFKTRDTEIIQGYLNSMITNFVEKRQSQI